MWKIPTSTYSTRIFSVFSVTTPVKIFHRDRHWHRWPLATDASRRPPILVVNSPCSARDFWWPKGDLYRWLGGYGGWSQVSRGEIWPQDWAEQGCTFSFCISQSPHESQTALGGPSNTFHVENLANKNRSSWKPRSKRFWKVRSVFKIVIDEDEDEDDEADDDDDDYFSISFGV